MRTRRFRSSRQESRFCLVTTLTYFSFIFALMFNLFRHYRSIFSTVWHYRSAKSDARRRAARIWLVSRRTARSQQRYIWYRYWLDTHARWWWWWWWSLLITICVLRLANRQQYSQYKELENDGACKITIFKYILQHFSHFEYVCISQNKVRLCSFARKYNITLSCF